MLNLSILIVTWNNEDVIGPCLSSIKHTLYPSEYTIYLADNASADNTVKIIESSYTEVNLTVNNKNIGFGAANNRLIPLCNSECILFLNPDTIVQSEALRILVNYLKDNPSVGAVGPRLLNSDGSIQLTDMSFPSWTAPFKETFSFQRALRKNLISSRLVNRYSKSKEPIDVDWVMGACLLTKREVLEEVGYFNEKYFMYCEETDLCRRIKKKGWRVCYHPMSKIVHLGGVGIGLYNSSKIFEIHKSQIILLMDLLPHSFFILSKIGYFIKSLMRICQWQIAFLDLNDLALDKIRGYWRVFSFLVSNWNFKYDKLGILR
jgi:N-acetylglucosaminyl-diphospho-decaprenol L-rhamnosyltransferase